MKYLPYHATPHKSTTPISQAHTQANTHLIVLPITFKDISARSRPQARLGALKRGLAEQLGAVLQDLAQEAVRFGPTALRFCVYGPGMYGHGEDGLLGVCQVAACELFGEEDVSEFRARVAGLIG